MATDEFSYILQAPYEDAQSAHCALEALHIAMARLK